MAMDFSGNAGAASSFDVLPHGLLVFAILTVKGIKASAAGGGYLDCELTVDANQPHAGRKLFDMIGDPMNSGNSEKYREMGALAITRILECRGAGPNNLAGYKLDAYEQLSGARVGIKVGVEVGTNGHNDKNRVAEWLTPNPASQSGNKGWVKLVAGDHGITAPAAAQQAGGFGGFSAGAAASTPAAASGFGNAGGAAAASSGFGAAAANNAGAANAASQQMTSGFAATGAATTSSPSEPGATPGWLAQAAQ